MFPSFQVVNDLLNPAGQNLRIREDAQVMYSFSYSFFNVLYVIKCQLSHSLLENQRGCSGGG